MREIDSNFLRLLDGFHHKDYAPLAEELRIYHLIFFFSALAARGAPYQQPELKDFSFI